MTPMTALMVYVVWTILLALSYATYRVPLVLTGSKNADHWERNSDDPADDPLILQRAKAAHLNCVENLPLFAAVVLAAAALGQTVAIAGVAAWVLYLRLGQSIAHLIGTSMILILIRGTLFVLQCLLILYMAFSLMG